nr:hypothetical protein [Tanacetum cinerariifolium]
MKTKRKLVPKSNPDTGDRNVGPLDVADRTHNVNSKAPAKKQCVSGSSFVSCRPIDVGPSDVQNVPTVGGAALPTTSVTQPTSTSQRCNTLKSNLDIRNRSVAPLDVPDRIHDNIPTVRGTALPITGFNQPASTSQRCDAAPAAKHQTLSHSIIPTSISRHHMDIGELSGDVGHVIDVDNYSNRRPGNQAVVTPMFQQP